MVRGGVGCVLIFFTCIVSPLHRTRTCFRLMVPRGGSGSLEREDASSRQALTRTGLANERHILHGQSGRLEAFREKGSNWPARGC